MYLVILDTWSLFLLLKVWNNAYCAFQLSLEKWNGIMEKFWQKFDSFKRRRCQERFQMLLWPFSKVFLVSLISTGKQLKFPTLTFENRHSNIWKRPWQRWRFNDQTFVETFPFQAWVLSAVYNALFVVEITRPSAASRTHTMTSTTMTSHVFSSPEPSLTQPRKS